jgi:hypothetical protein
LQPKWVKANSIIYIIGLKPIEFGDSIRFDTMTTTEKEYFGKRAYDGLTRLNPSVISCNGGKDCGDVRQKAFDLIQYLQAYDLLKAGGYIEPYDQDRNSTKNKITGETVYLSPRDKLRAFSRNLYIESFYVINGNIGWKKNHGIICSSALIMSSLILNDAGVETAIFDDFLYKLFHLRTYGFAMPHPNYSPIKWYERGHGTEHGRNLFHPNGEDGIEDNFFIGKHMLWVDDVPQSNSDGTAGYAEGPGYFSDLANAFLPCLRTTSNTLPKSSSKNYLAQEKYVNILKWYLGILNNNDYSHPTYDNSPSGGNFLGILGEPNFPSNANFIPDQNSNIDLRGDYLLAMGSSTGEPTLDASTYSEASGNIILRNNNKYSSQTFQMLCEKDFAIDKEASKIDGTHEDDDMASWSLFVQSKDTTNNSNIGNNWQLGVDPPYFTWGLVNATNHYNMHNTVEINAGLNVDGRIYKYPKFEWIKNSNYQPIKEYNLTFDFKINKESTLYGNAIRRNVLSLNNDEVIYYIINDFVDATNIPEFESIKVNINGNGNEELFYNNGANCTFYKSDLLYTWSFPCSTNTDGWKLSSSIGAFKGGITSNLATDSIYTKNWENGMGTKGSGISGNYHTRLTKEQTVRKSIFQSFIYPSKCGETLPIVTINDTSYNYVSTDIDFIVGKDTSFEARLGKNHMETLVNDTSCHLHLTRWLGSIPDSASNPFNLPNQANYKLYFDAQKIFMNYHTLSYMGEGYKFCPPSYSNYRTAIISNGSYVIYLDTLIFSDVPLNFDFSIAGRQTYTCSISPLAEVSSGDSIKLKLPDVARGIDMIALVSENDTLKSRYDSLTNYIYIALPNVSKQFTIQERNLCNDCYFPPLGTHIDTLFAADDGNIHRIPRPLNINYPLGQMQINNATRITMCEGVYLLNQDSLIIEGPPQSKGMLVPTCFGIDSIAKGSNNSMLIVSSGSALVLDAGSKTYVKSGAGIYIKQNGSLIIKDGAYLQIGDSGTGGWGEIIAEAGSYIYIEPNATIEYRSTIGDTSDINLFSIAVGNNTAQAGVYYWMDSMLKAEGIIASTIYPIAICDLDSLNPIGNKQWGYTNFAKPEIHLQFRNDTLCPGEPLYIHLNRIINDASAEIRVCRWDSIFIKGNFAYVECVDDSLILDSIPPDPICRLPRTMPEDWTYYFDVNTRHQVSIGIMNECGKRIDTSFLVVVKDTPIFQISVPSTACEGYQTVQVLASENSNDSVLYTFEVTEILDTNSINYQIGNPGEVFSQTSYGLLPDTFDFPGFYFRGGRSYTISLSLTNSCGSRTVEGEIEIPSGVYIEMERSQLYANPIHGARSVQLHGYISSADSFRWEPTTWLNRTDTLVVVSTPEDSMAYVLIAKDGDCIAYDTVEIRYNRVANAGEGDTVCYTNTKVLLGNSYDLSVFLGYLYYKGGSQFRDAFTAKTGTDWEYFSPFTLFMKTDEFKNWAEGCTTLYSNFTEDLMREETIKEPWFIDYFEMLTLFDNTDMIALDTFVYNIDLNSTLQSNYASTGDWGSFEPCVSTLLDLYDNFKSSQINTVSISWIKIVDTDTSYNGSLQESSIAVDEPTHTSIYVQNVITPFYAEIDETIVYVDTLMNVAFTPILQFDSSIVFQDITEPFGSGSSFLWDFGDGSSGSMEQHPMHEFPAFDTLFRVCLTVSNSCGNATYCDTVYLDSSHWGGNLNKVGTVINSTKIDNLNSDKQKNFKAIFYPNPTLGNGVLAYSSVDEFESGEIKIMDTQGKLILEFQIEKKQDYITIPLELFPNGLYFYTIITSNGNEINGKIVKL